MCMFKSVNDVDPFLEYLNTRHNNIKFTVEREVDGKLPYLDVLVDRVKSSKISTSLYRKKTFTGLMMNFTSYCTFSYKIGLIKTLVDRIYKINNSWLTLDHDINELHDILMKNQFPRNLIDKYIKSYLNNQLAPKSAPVDESTRVSKMRYIKLPYVGSLSGITQLKINRIIKNYCKDVSIKLVFTSFKVSSYFTCKDALPSDIKSGVVYKFTCAGCNTSYIGETSRHISIRIADHLGKDKASHVFKHWQEKSDCKQKCDSSCFSVLDSAPTDYQRKLKEAMFIQWQKPVLNKQVNHLSLSISV